MRHCAACSVDVFGSSGGAVDGLALVEAHLDDMTVLVAHEPPLTHLLPDAEAVRRAERDISRAYQQAGFGHGTARFITYTSWEGERALRPTAARPCRVRAAERGRRRPRRPVCCQAIGGGRSQDGSGCP
jgi:hypothetical protein